MTRVLHTADVHLAPAAAKRWAALDRILELARAEAVDALTIGGDLFDSPGDLERFRADLRNEYFSDQPFEILLIPGNHDVGAFRGDVFFGDSCTVLAEEPFTHWTAHDGDLRITAIPYRERPDDELLLALQERQPFEGAEALLLHCSLDAPFADAETGDEGTRRYFPVTEELLVELGFDYYLAGHYHSPHQVTLENGATFTYPGSPASTTSAETGRRRVSWLEPENGIDFETLNTFHYARRQFVVTPGDEAAVLEDLREWADANAVPSAEASVQVEGFVEMAEGEFNDRLQVAAGSAEVTDDTRSVEHVQSHPLYRSFQEELAEQDWDQETSQAVTERTLEVFSHLSLEGEI